MKKALLLSLFIICISQITTAHHQLGGDLIFEQTGANSFDIKLRSVRADTLPVYFTVRIFDNSHSLINSIILNRDSSKAAYFGFDSSIKTYLFYYSGVVTLANNTNGYYATIYDGSARAYSSLNVANGTRFFNNAIPTPSIIGGNSNPSFTQYLDSTYLLINQTKSIDFSAIDPDGDSLVYSIITPSGSCNNNGSKPFVNATWKSGFNLSNILGPGSVCTINSSTGIVTTRASAIGIYTVAVRCEEFRNGIKIGEITREIPIGSINTPVTVSVNDHFSDSFVSIFPNPTPSGLFFIESKINSNTPLTINIYSINGKKVFYSEQNNSKYKIDLSNLEKGVYFITITQDNQKITKRIIIS